MKTSNKIKRMIHMPVKQQQSSQQRSATGYGGSMTRSLLLFTLAAISAQQASASLIGEESEGLLTAPENPLEQTLMADPYEPEDMTRHLKGAKSKKPKKEKKEKGGSSAKPTSSQARPTYSTSTSTSSSQAAAVAAPAAPKAQGPPEWAASHNKSNKDSKDISEDEESDDGLDDFSDLTDIEGLDLIGPVIDPDVENPCVYRLEINPFLFDRTYNIAGDPVVVPMPNLIGTPNGFDEACEFTFDYEIDDPAGDLVVSFDGDAFTFEYDQDLLPVTLDDGTIVEARDYTVTVTAVDDEGLFPTTGSFNLKVGNPCTNEFLREVISPLEGPSPVEYRLTDPPLEVDILSLLDLATLPNQTAICMADLMYSLALNGAAVDMATEPVYVTSNSFDDLGFDIFSENFDFIGNHVVSIKAILPGYTEEDIMHGGDMDPTDPFSTQVEIEIISPCIDPDLVEAAPLADPAEWDYSGALTWTLDPWTVVPEGCAPEFVFSCAQLDQPLGAMDLCSAGTLNAMDGSFSFETIDKASYPPGDYQIVITGTVGSGSDSVVVTVTIVDPCLTTPLTLDQKFPELLKYTLRDEALEIFWEGTKSTLLKETPVSCGAPMFTFTNADGTEIDATIFDDVRNADGFNSLNVLYSEDPNIVGDYSLNLVAYYEDAVDNTVTSDAFTVTIVDPCESPLGIFAASLSSQEYTITDDQKEYAFAASIAEPSFCPVTYTLSVSDSGIAAVTLDTDTDPMNPKIVFSYDADLTLSGETSTDYTVEVTSTAGSVDEVTSTQAFTLTIKNPCVDPDFVYLTPETLSPISYVIGAPKQTETAHPEFSVMTLPNSHSLCGDIAYEALFEDEAVTGDPLSYDSATRVIEVESRDLDLLGKPRKYQIKASLADYASSMTASTAIAEAEADFTDPCLSTFGFSASDQTSPADNKYTGENIIFDLVPFNLDPSDLCSVAYRCKDVTFDAVSSTTLTCRSFTESGILFDPNFSNLEGGSLTFSADSDDYLESNYLPGTYTVTIVGKVIGSNDVTAETTFTLTLVDPCETPMSLDPPVLDEQNLTLMQDDYPSYTHPDFVVDPSYCPVAYTYQIDDISNNSGLSAITQNDKNFAFLYQTDLVPLGETQTVTITATSGSLTQDASFTTSFSNPCTDKNYVTITTDNTLMDKTYAVGDALIIFSQENQSGGIPFGIQTRPFDYQFCGGLSYVALFDGQVITSADRPLSYEENGEDTFSLQTDLTSFENTSVSYRLIAELADYPIATYPTADQQVAIGSIAFEAAAAPTTCTGATSIQSVQQANPASDAFTGSIVPFTVTEFTADPAICTGQIDYTCSNVIGPESADYTAQLCTPLTQQGRLDFQLIARSEDFIDNGGALPAGEYAFTIQGSVADVGGSFVTATAGFRWTLLPPVPGNITPFVEDVSPRGMITFGVESNTESSSGTTRSRRLLYSASGNEKEEQMLSSEVGKISVQLVSTKDSELAPIDVDWTFVDFDGEMGHIQMDLDKLDGQNVDFEVYDDVKITFNSDDDVEAQTAPKSVNWKLPPNVEKDTLDGIELAGKLGLILIGIALTISFVLAVAYSGSLVSTWLFVNTMQLIAHVPLISGKLPANAHYFFLNFVSVARLSFESVNFLLDDIDSEATDSELIQDQEKSHFTEMLHYFGYRASFFRSALTILCFAFVFGLVCLFCYFFARVSRANTSSSEGGNSFKTTMTNIMVRFGLVASFELMICSFISLSNFHVTSNADQTMSFLTLIGITASLVLTSMLFVKYNSKPAQITATEAPQAVAEDVENNNEPQVEDLQTEEAEAEDEKTVEIQIEEVADLDMPQCNNQSVMGRYKATDIQLFEDPLPSGRMDTARNLVTEADYRVSETGSSQTVAQNDVSSNSALMSGLKPEKSAALQPVAFLAQRLIFAIAIVFMTDAPALASLSVLATSVAMLGYVILKKPWMDAENQKLDTANGSLLCFTILLGFFNQSTDKENVVLGWMLVIVLSTTILLNIFVILAQATRHVLAAKESKVEEESQKTIAQQSSNPSQAVFEVVSA